MYRLILLIGIFFVGSYAQSWLSSTPEPKQIQQPSDSSQVIADRIVESKIPVLVDFWAPWCGPCRMLGPVIEELKKEYSGKMTFMKVNVDVNRKLSAYFKISSIPAVFLIKNKSVVNYLPGLQSKQTYKQAIEKTLHDAPKTSSEKSPENTSIKPSPDESAASANDE
jgi:thioredoxin 1